MMLITTGRKYIGEQHKRTNKKDRVINLERKCDNSNEMPLNEAMLTTLPVLSL